MRAPGTRREAGKIDQPPRGTRDYNIGGAAYGRQPSSLAIAIGDVSEGKTNLFVLRLKGRRKKMSQVIFTASRAPSRVVSPDPNRTSFSTHAGEPRLPRNRLTP